MRKPKPTALLRTDVFRNYVLRTTLEAALTLSVLIGALVAIPLLIDARTDFGVIAAWIGWIALLLFAIWRGFAFWTAFKAFARRYAAAREE